MDVVSHYAYFGKKKGGGKRSEITGGFSPQSRKRLFMLLNSLRENAIRKSLFVTLTYHRENVSRLEVKQHRKNFFESLRRAHPESSAIWKLEFQDRGSPHYHIILFRRYLSHEWVARTWNRIAEPGDKLHLAAGTEVRPVRRSDSAVSYVGKYMAKLEGSEEAASWGRYWGVHNRKKLPLSKTRIIRLYGSTPREIIEEWSPKICGNNGDEVNELTIFTRSTEELSGIFST